MPISPRGNKVTNIRPKHQGRCVSGLTPPNPRASGSCSPEFDSPHTPSFRYLHSCLDSRIRRTGPDTLTHARLLHPRVEHGLSHRREIGSREVEVVDGRGFSLKSCFLLVQRWCWGRGVCRGWQLPDGVTKYPNGLLSLSASSPFGG